MSSASVDSARVRHAMPCSVTMPAGTGKTEIIAAVTRLASEANERALILTHTHAGLGALRRRAHAMGVAASSLRIDTVASWSHQLVRHYPDLAGVTVPPEPDWTQSAVYYQGATRVAQSLCFWA